MPTSPTLSAASQENRLGEQSLNYLGTRARAENPFYIATIYQPKTKIGFRGWVPQQFNLSIHNNWEPVFGSLNEQNNLAKRAAQAVGFPVNIKAFTQQIWTGTEPLEFEFTFLLDAYEDAYLDVQKPIKDLLRLATPTRNGPFLDSPGPSVVDNSRSIYLRVGRFFFLDSIVITSVNITWHTLSDVRGQYQAADVSVGMRTSYTPDQDDIIKYFERGNSDNTDPIYQNLGQEAVQGFKDLYNSFNTPITGPAADRPGANGPNQGFFPNLPSPIVPPR